MSNRQISLRPSPELLHDIEVIGEEYQISDADVLRQLVIVGLKSYKAGKVPIARAKNKWSSRVTAKMISKKMSGRKVNYGVIEQPPASEPLPLEGVSNE